MIVLDLARSVVGVVGMAASKIAPLDERFALDQRIIGPWPEGPFLWLHGASLGECRMLLNVAKYIQEDIKNCPKILITTQKADVLEFLQQSGANITCCIAPADTPYTMVRFIKKVRPIGLVLAENELWPGYLSSMRKLSLKPAVSIISGRYQMAISKGDFSAIGFACMQSGTDLSRLVSECPPEIASKIQIGGDWKLLPWVRSKKEIEAPQNPTVDTTFLSFHFSEWNSLLRMTLSSIKRQESVVIIPRRLEEVDHFRNELRDQELLVVEWPLVQKGAVSLVSKYGQTVEVLEKSKTAVVGGSFSRTLGVHDFWEPLQLGVSTCVGPYSHGHKSTVDALVREGVLSQLRSTADYAKRDLPDIRLVKTFLTHERAKISESYSQFIAYLEDLIQG